MHSWHLLARAAQVHGHRPAVYFGNDLVHTYAQLAQRAAGLASMLREKHGLKGGDHVAIFMQNRPEYLELTFGAWLAGITVVPINSKLHEEELGYILDHSTAKMVFTSEENHTTATKAVGSAIKDKLITVGSQSYEKFFPSSTGSSSGVPTQDKDSVAWLFYTSGTTGKPKGAQLTHENLFAMTASYLADVDQISPEDCMLHAGPMSHGSGLYVLPHVAKAAAHVVPQSGHYDPDEVISLLHRHSGATMFLAPTMLSRLLTHLQPPTGHVGNHVSNHVTNHVSGHVTNRVSDHMRDPLPGLKTIVYGGGPMYLADVDRAQKVLGVGRVAQIYGQGESPMTITALGKQCYVDFANASQRDKERMGSVGTRQLAVQVEVVGPDGKVLGPGEIGEVVVKGPAVMKGYWRNEAATAETLRDGWLHTGDLGRMSADGYLTLTDRNKDVVISGGSNIYPREVEEVLLTHPHVGEVAVVGTPHAEWGEMVVAFVVPRMPVDGTAEGQRAFEHSLEQHCLAHMARFKRPRRYVLSLSLPKNNYGKVLKTDLRAQTKEFGLAHAHW